MKKNQLKIILLVLLASLMVYIWWGNIQTFNQSNSNEQLDDSSNNISVPHTTGQEIKYRKPKLNPFKRYANSQQKPKPKQLKRQPQKTSHKLSTLYTLQGIVLEKNSSQAIITNTEGNSSILSLNEHIQDWNLIQIDKNQIIFKNDKLYDTLHLQTIK